MNSQFLKLLEAGNMSKRKDLSPFDKGQVVMARGLDQSICKTAGLFGVFQVYSGQHLPKVVQGRTTSEPENGHLTTWT